MKRLYLLGFVALLLSACLGALDFFLWKSGQTSAIERCIMLGSLVLIAFAAVFFGLALRCDAKEAKASLMQLHRLKEGDLSQREVRMCSRPLHDLAEAINALPHQKATAPDGRYLSKEDFIRRVEAEIASSPTYRAGLIAIKLCQYQKEKYLCIKAKALSLFPIAWKGEEKGTVFLYQPHILNEDELEGKLHEIADDFPIGDIHIHVAFLPDYPKEEALSLLFGTQNEQETIIFYRKNREEEALPTAAYAKRNETLFLERFIATLRHGEGDLDFFYHRAGIEHWFPEVGFALYDEGLKGFRCVRVIASEGAQLFQEGQTFPQEVLDPLLYRLGNQPFLLVSDTSFLPGFLQLEGLKSIALSHEEGTGVIYLCSSAILPLLDYEDHKRLFLFFEGALAWLRKEKLRTISNQCTRLLEQMEHLSRRHLYEIEKDTHRLSYLSPFLQQSFPRARLGEPCHYVLHGREEPCPLCPLQTGQPLLTVMLALGSAKQCVELLQENETTTLSIRKSEGDSAFASDLACFDEEFTQLCLDHNYGCLLGVRLETYGLSKALDVLKERNLADSLYSIDEQTLLYLLPKEPEWKAERLREILEGLFPDESLRFALLRFPVEVTCPHEVRMMLHLIFSLPKNTGFTLNVTQLLETKGYTVGKSVYDNVP